MLLGIASFLFCVAALSWDLPLWLLVVALGGMALGGLMSLPVAYENSRNQGRSRTASVWRAVTEPVRFMFRWTF